MAGDRRSVRVSVVRRHCDPLVVRGLVEVLRGDSALNVFVCELERAAPAAAVARSVPQVAILDERAADSGALASAHRSNGIVVLAREPPLPYGMVLLAAGVTCLDIGSSEGSLLAAVHLTAQGGCMFVSGNRERFEREDRCDRLLTQRERQVLGLIGKRESYGEIALTLKISVDTVQKHASSLLRKLQASSRRDLVAVPSQWLRWAATSSEP